VQRHHLLEPLGERQEALGVTLDVGRLAAPLAQQVFAVD
jgi:hypothetical protein